MNFQKYNFTNDRVKVCFQFSNMSKLTPCIAQRSEELEGR